MTTVASCFVAAAATSASCDVFAVRLVDGQRPPYPYALSDLLLAIEVESPSNPFLDYQIKRELYLSNGVPEYWIANTEGCIVSRWRTPDDPGRPRRGFQQADHLATGWHARCARRGPARTLR
jgi:hypothetical protein